MPANHLYLTADRGSLGIGCRLPAGVTGRFLCLSFCVPFFLHCRFVLEACVCFGERFFSVGR